MKLDRQACRDALKLRLRAPRKSVTTWRNAARKKSLHFIKAPNYSGIRIPPPGGGLQTQVNDWATGRCRAPAARGILDAPIAVPDHNDACPDGACVDFRWHAGREEPAHDTHRNSRARKRFTQARR